MSKITEPWWKNRRGEWYVILQGLLFVLAALGPKTAPGLPAWSGRWTAGLALAGVALVIAGGLLSASAVFRLGSNLSALPHPVEGARLVVSGPYRLVRHPIYAGIILAGLGWGLFNRSTLGVFYAVLLFVFFDIKSRREEFWMRQQLADYADYQAGVRKLIPFVY